MSSTVTSANPRSSNSRNATASSSDTISSARFALICTASESATTSRHLRLRRLVARVLGVVREEPALFDQLVEPVVEAVDVVGVVLVEARQSVLRQRFLDADHPERRCDAVVLEPRVREVLEARHVHLRAAHATAAVANL